MNGDRVTSKTNGKSIFLPAAGVRYNADLYDVESGGYYWSSSLSTDDPGRACYVYFRSDHYTWDISNRFNGFSVRPVSE